MRLETFRRGQVRNAKGLLVSGGACFPSFSSKSVAAPGEIVLDLMRLRKTEDDMVTVKTTIREYRDLIERNKNDLAQSIARQVRRSMPARTLGSPAVSPEGCLEDKDPPHAAP